MVEQSFPSWKLIHLDQGRGEIMLEKKDWLGTHDIIISVYRMPAGQSAIDVVSAKRGFLGDFGSSYRNIQAFFQALHTRRGSE